MSPSKGLPRCPGVAAGGAGRGAVRGPRGAARGAVRGAREGIDDAAEFSGRAGTDDAVSVDEIRRGAEDLHAPGLGLVAPHPLAMAPSIERRLERAHVESELPGVREEVLV